MPVAKADQWSSLFSISVTESAANTLTFKKLETGVSVTEKVAWIISRIEWFTSTLATVFDTTSDKLDMALVASNSVSDISDLTNPAVIALLEILRQDYGTAASGGIALRPFITDFTNIPGGGLLVPPTPLYLATKGTGLASASNTTIRGYYTAITLSVDEYWGLVQARRIISST